jgi:cytochrome c oxidase cbb3-type subunit III
MCAKRVTEKPKEMTTTGHSWDGIEELNNPLPRWWVWTFYLTILFAIGYTIAFPAWPLVTWATQGVIGSNQRLTVAADIQAWDDRNAPIRVKLVAADVNSIPNDPALKDFAVNAGRAVFNTYCVQCHMREGQGNRTGGYPTLSDNDWLFGGSMEAIVATITHGIRNTTDPDARNVGFYMPAWSEHADAGPMKDAATAQLTDEQIGQVVNYVLKISGQTADEAKATAGALIFADNCVACHGEDGKGNRDMGAPNLTDAIWLGGGDEAALTKTIAGGRGGVMPAWGGRLSQADIISVATYVHALGGGE